MNAGTIEGLHHLGFSGSPLVGIAFSGSYKARHGSAGYAARGLDEHLKVESISKAPKNLAHGISRESKHGF